MARLFNFDTGTVEDVAPDQYQAALASGRYAPRKGERINVVSLRGERSSIDAAEIPKAIAQGYSIESPDITRERTLQEQFGGVGQTTIAALEGAARGATLGLSDVALRAAGVDMEAAKLRREASPVVSTVGEIGGAIAPTLLTGGAAGGASAARLGVGAVRTIGAPARLAAGAGKLVTSRIGGAVGASAARKLAARAAGGAVEGAMFGLGQAVTESQLEDIDLTAERIVAHVGSGAILGGVAPVALGIATKGAALGVTAAKKGSAAIARSIEDVYEKTTGRKPAAGLGQAFLRMTSKPAIAIAKKVAKLGGASDDAVDLIGNEAKAEIAAKMTDNALDDMARNRASQLSVLDNTLDDLTDQAKGIAKKGNIANLTKGHKGGDAFGTADGLLGGVEAEIDDMIDAGAGSYGFSPFLKKLNARVKTVRGKIRELSDPGSDVSRATIFDELDRVKRDVGKFRQRMGRSGMQTDTMIATQSKIEDFYERFRVHLEDVGLYGRGGEAQKRINAVWSQYIGNEKNAFGFATQIGEEHFEKVYQADAGKIRRFLDSVNDPAVDQQRAYLQKKLQLGKQLLAEISDSYELSPELVAKAKSGIGTAGQIEKALGNDIHKITLRDQLRELDRIPGIMGNLGTGGAVVGGGIVGGVPGAIAGALVGASANPGQLVRQLAFLRKTAAAFDDKAGAAIVGFMSASAKRAGRVASGVVSKGPAIAVVGSRGKMADTFAGMVHDEDIKRSDDPPAIKAADQLLRYAADPGRLIENAHRAVDGAEKYAPQTKNAIMAAATRAAGFLASKVPATVRGNPMERRDRKMSPAEERKFYRYARAVQDPGTILEDLENGTLTREGVEAVREVYPRIYEDIVQKLATAIAEQPQKFAYIDRVQLSILMSQPFDQTTRPEYIQAAQQGYTAQAQAQQPSAQQPVRKSGLPKLLTSDSNIGTRAQRLEAGK